MLLLLSALAHAEALPVVVHWIPWGTVTALTLVDTGLQWGSGATARPSVGGGVAVLAGPAALRLSAPAATPRPSMDATEITGLSAGFLARLDAPRAGTGETMGRELGGYARLGHKPVGGEESRATLALGWRQSLGAEGPTGHGQLVTTFVAERRILPVAAVTVHLEAAYGNAALPWRLAAGAGAMIGF